MASKIYCLRCEKFNACSCGKIDKKFSFSNKLRPPATKNKVKFRKFLDDCPQFANCVTEELQSDFRDLLTKVKYFNKAINGMQWTIIKN